MTGLVRPYDAATDEAVSCYQRRGFRLTGLRAGAADEARRTLRPTIPTVGQHGIEMHDELELSRVVPPG